MAFSSGTGRPIGVGIVGLSASGGWAARAHVPALRAIDGYELRALSASSAASAQAAGRAHGVPLTFGSPAELAAHRDVDLVVVTVRVPDHRELVTAALDAGKAVLCEWPLGNGLAEAVELADLARSRGLSTAVGLQARSAPAVRHLRDLVADGYVGEVLSTTVVASGGPWGAEVGAASQRYLVDAANGATMLTIPFGHTLDGLASVLGEPARLTATLATRRTRVRDVDSGELLPMTAPDQVAVTGRLTGGVAGGAVAALHYRGGMSRGTNFRWEINGTEGDLVVSAPSGHLQLSPVSIRGGRGGDTGLAELTVPAGYHRVPGLAPDHPGYAVAHAYAQLLEDERTGRTVVPDFDHAVRRHRSIAAIEHAAADSAAENPAAGRATAQ
ncbi:MAG TPA: Gfo/Idh/MocA family oxidoreductase [Pseudonocardia sp.]|jgi:predicted dehydrogenase